jgi:hypothetical protein
MSVTPRYAGNALQLTVNAAEAAARAVHTLWRTMDDDQREEWLMVGDESTRRLPLVLQLAEDTMNVEAEEFGTEAEKRAMAERVWRQRGGGDC